MENRTTNRSVLVSEIFFTIQGEGALIGRPTVFVRTGGCDFRCQWCDTLYAVLPEHKNEWKPMAPAAILAEIERLSHQKPILVTLSGGNPALQPLEPLLDLGHARGHTFALETQGSVAKKWFEKLDFLVLSPKPPSSGMENDWEKVAGCLEAAKNAHTSLKIVVFDENDYQFARQTAARFPNVAFFLQVGNPAPGQNCAVDTLALTARLEWLLELAVRDGWHQVAILPQLHVLLWGNKRGV